MSIDSISAPKNTFQVLTRLIVFYPLIGSTVNFLPIENFLIELNISLSHYYFLLHLLAAVWLVIFWRSILAPTRFLYLTGILLLSVYYGQILAPYYLKHSSAQSGKVDFKIYYVNVEVTNTNYQRLIQSINKTDPDILVLLEANQNWGQEISAKTLLPFRTEKIIPAVSGFILFSKFPITAPVSSQTDPRLVSYNPVELQIRENRFLKVIGFEASPPLNNFLLSYRNQILKNVAALSANLSGDVILLGDLNTSIFSAAYQDFLKQAKLTDAMNGFGLQPSWIFANIKFLFLTIDHVFYRGAIQPVSFQTLEDIGSDHRPFLVKFKVN